MLSIVATQYILQNFSNNAKIVLEERSFNRTYQEFG
jgi:hypothetical protein